MNENNVLVICVFTLFVLFSGEPDIADGIISFLMKP